MKKFNARILMLLVSALVLQGCGYSLHGQASLPFKEVWVGAIENRTDEPGLEDVLHRALVEELSKQGVGVSRASGLKLSGVVKRFEIPSLSEKDGITREYRVLIDADFRLTDEAGKTVDMRNFSSPFIVPFAASDDFGGLLASKAAATDRVLRDLSARLVGALIYK
ncbi:MAG: LptE family protein [Nitrospirae bacterium]|nr:LptE family protein [Nitrospirota bacterium]